MYRNLNICRKILVSNQWCQRLVMPAATTTLEAISKAGFVRQASGKSVPTDNPNVVDINVNDMAHNDEEFAREFTTTVLSTPRAVTEPSSTVTDPAITSVDINPWAEDGDTEPKDGNNAKDIGAEFDHDGPEYPPIPEDRKGEYKFKGIKVKLPPNMLQEGTYRYRLDKEDEHMADDIRVCRYDPC